MRVNSRDETIKRNYAQIYQHYVAEYEQVKQGLHPSYRRVGEFYAALRIQRQTFLKYYGRYRNSGADAAKTRPEMENPAHPRRDRSPRPGRAREGMQPP